MKDTRWEETRNRREGMEEMGGYVRGRREEDVHDWAGHAGFLIDYKSTLLFMLSLDDTFYYINILSINHSNSKHCLDHINIE